MNGQERAKREAEKATDYNDKKRWNKLASLNTGDNLAIMEGGLVVQAVFVGVNVQGRKYVFRTTGGNKTLEQVVI